MISPCQKDIFRVVFDSSALASGSAPAGPRLLLSKSKFVRVVFVFSAVATDSVPAGPMLLPRKCKFVRVLFVFSAVAMIQHRQDQCYCHANANSSEMCLLLAL